jgi:hypothetical protein
MTSRDPDSVAIDSTCRLCPSPKLCICSDPPHRVASKVIEPVIGGRLLSEVRADSARRNRAPFPTLFRGDSQVHLQCIFGDGMGTLIQLPKQLLPFALYAKPSRPGSLSKFVLTATAWNTDETPTPHGFIKLADLLDELSELGADRAIIGSVRRALEVGRACVIPKMWLTPPQIQLFKKPARRAGLLRAFVPPVERTSFVDTQSSNRVAQAQRTR